LQGPKTKKDILVKAKCVFKPKFNDVLNTRKKGKKENATCQEKMAHENFTI